MDVQRYDSAGSSAARSLCRFSLICWAVGIIALLIIRSNINFVLNLFTGSVGRMALEVISILVVIAFLAAIVCGPVGLIVAIANRKTFGRRRWIIIGTVETIASIAIASLFIIDRLQEPPCDEFHPEYPYCHFDENGALKRK